MQLEPLFDVDYRYAELHTVQPSAGADGRAYGSGTAEFRGRVSGTATWSNFPRLHADQAWPDARGVLPLGADRFVLFSVSGLSSLTDGSGIHVMRFETEDAEHSWLNDVLAVGEGSIDAQRGLLAMRYYRCVVDHLPPLPV